MAENAQQDPHDAWFLTGLTTPKGRQSKLSGAGAASALKLAVASVGTRAVFLQEKFLAVFDVRQVAELVVGDRKGGETRGMFGIVLFNEIGIGLVNLEPLFELNAGVLA